METKDIVMAILLGFIVVPLAAVCVGRLRYMWVESEKAREERGKKKNERQ
jgi:hypothetical protein